MSFKFFCKLTNSWCGRDVLEMRLLRLLGIAVLLESLKKLLQGLLRDFTPSSLQVSKFCESETRIQLMSGRIERPPQRNTLRILHCQSSLSLKIKTFTCSHHINGKSYLITTNFLCFVNSYRPTLQ